MNGITSKNIQDILSILYTFIILKLNGQNELTAFSPPDQRYVCYLYSLHMLLCQNYKYENSCSYIIVKVLSIIQFTK